MLLGVHQQRDVGRLVEKDNENEHISSTKQPTSAMTEEEERVRSVNFSRKGNLLRIAN